VAVAEARGLMEVVVSLDPLLEARTPNVEILHLLAWALLLRPINLWRSHVQTRTPLCHGIPSFLVPPMSFQPGCRNFKLYLTHTTLSWRKGTTTLPPAPQWKLRLPASSVYCAISTEGFLIGDDPFRLKSWRFAYLYKIAFIVILLLRCTRNLPTL